MAAEPTIRQSVLPTKTGSSGDSDVAPTNQGERGTSQAPPTAITNNTADIKKNRTANPLSESRVCMKPVPPNDNALTQNIVVRRADFAR